MKKKVFIIMTAVSAVLLTACGTSVPNLSKMDNNKAAEYMAGEILKNDEDYAFALDYDRDVLNPTPTPMPVKTPAPTPAPKEGGSSTGQGQNSGTDSDGTGSDGTEAPALEQVSVSDVFGINSVSIDVTSSSLKKSYGEDYESFVAPDGKKLLIVYFKLKNTAGADQKVNLMKDKPDYRLSAGGKTVAPSHSAAKGDLQYFSDKISAGKSKQGILMFEVDQDINLSESSLTITNGAKQATVSLK